MLFNKAAANNAYTIYKQGDISLLYRDESNTLVQIKRVKSYIFNILFVALFFYSYGEKFNSSVSSMVTNDVVGVS